MPARNIVVVCSGSHEKKVNLVRSFPLALGTEAAFAWRLVVW